MLNETLYIKDNRGAMRIWRIEIVENKLIINHGLINGTLQTKEETIRVGLAGRSLEEQVKLRFLSRINEQYKKGYKDSIEEASRSQGTNAMNLYKPMLAQPLKNVKLIDYAHAFTQFKYDGHRCLITKRNGKTVAYSRKGQIIESVEHILADVDLAEGQTLDGELYCHGESLQTISSWVRRNQPRSAELQYHVYDIIEDTSYQGRIRLLKQLSLGGTVKVAPTMVLSAPEDVSQRFLAARKLGYEGLILRWGEASYEAGKRSKSLVKIKSVMDDYFQIVDIHTSRDGWGILECMLSNGDTFKVNPPGTMEDRFDVANLPTDYIGRMVRVEFANLTKDGIPFHPVATEIE